MRRFFEREDVEPTPTITNADTNAQLTATEINPGGFAHVSYMTRAVMKFKNKWGVDAAEEQRLITLMRHCPPARREGVHEYLEKMLMILRSEKCKEKR